MHSLCVVELRVTVYYVKTLSVAKIVLIVSFVLLATMQIIRSSF
jgi:hypothetical protein